MNRLLALFIFLLPLASNSSAQEIRNLVDIEGIRGNQLVGYGLVVGLNGTGDNSQVKFAGQSVANMLKQFGLKMPERGDSRVKNVAAVMVSATLPPGYSRGQTIDVSVSSLGDAKSLRGGTLLLTQLRGADGEAYALAQGTLVINGVSAQGKSGSNTTINNPTSGRIPNGATIEQEIPTDFANGDRVRLNLKRPNIATANNIVREINRRYGNIASAANATSIEVNAPLDPTRRIGFVAELETLSVSAGKESPRVVINSRTGTVIITQGVKVRPVAIAHANLQLTVREQPRVSQPEAPFTNGQTRVVPNSDVSIKQQENKVAYWPQSNDLQTIVNMINRLGASPEDLMSIVQSLDQAGAIDAELVII